MAAPMVQPDSAVAGQKHIIDELESSFHVIEILIIYKQVGFLPKQESNTWACNCSEIIDGGV